MSLSEHCVHLIAQEQNKFEQEYQQHFLSGESKEKHIGSPYLLHNSNSSRGVLLVHGFMAAPEEVREWADFLFEQGYTVYAPRMAGHGTSATDLSQREMKEWLASVEHGHDILKACCDNIVIGGFSTGAAVALHQVITKPGEFEGLISISAPLKFKKFSAHFASPVNSWNKLLTRLGIEKGRKEFVTNHADNPHINYLRCPVNGIVEIKRLMKQVSKGLSKIDIPTLIIHADNDPKVDVESSREINKRLKTTHSRYREVSFDLHGIIRGPISDQVFNEVDLFLKQSLA